MASNNGVLDAIKAKIKGVHQKSWKTYSAIAKVETALSEVVAQLQSPSLSAEEKAALHTEEQRLRAEQQNLREKKKRLRKKEDQLREKELQLQREKRRKDAELYMQRVLALGRPSQTSLRREQLGLTAGGLPTKDILAWQLPELMHPVFAKAVEYMAGGAKLDKATIETAGKLCCIGADIYDDEADVIRAVRGLLGPYLEDENAVTICSGFASKKVSPDWALGDSPKKPSNLFLIVEAKPDFGSSEDPDMKGTDYLEQFWRHRADSATCRNTRCPAFLLEVVGPHARLSALAWLDGVISSPMTALLNLLPAHPATDRLLLPVARMLAALRAGVRELAAAHAAAAQAAPSALQQPAAASEKLPLPWPIVMDARYDAADAEQLAHRNPTYYVRLADSGGGEGSGGGGGEEAVVVKLCRKYGLAAHRAWADLGLAPQILRVEALPGGWQLVEMEWLSEHEWWHLSDLEKYDDYNEAQSAVQEALEFAHGATSMVHGDMRPPNCLVAEGNRPGLWQVRFVDFEWSGREGEATYPGFLNPDLPWPEGVCYGKPLQRTHDVQLLAAVTGGLVDSDEKHWAGGAAR